MNATQIRDAIDAGKKVFWSNKGYPVIKDSKGQYLIKCTFSKMCLGLTWADGETLNGKADDFFVED